MMYTEYLTTKKYEQRIYNQYGVRQGDIKILQELKACLDSLRPRSMTMYTSSAPVDGKPKLRPAEEGEDVIVPFQFMICNN